MKFPDIDTVAPFSWLRIRNWLLCKLVGKSVVIMNAEFAIVAQKEEGVHLVLQGLNGALIADNCFPRCTKNYQILQISQANFDVKA